MEPKETSRAIVAKAFIDDHLKVADAKSKKKKAKAKKEKKKKEAKKKAKEKQQKEAKKLASIKKQLDKIEKEVAKLKAKKINELNSKIAVLTAELNTKKASEKAESAMRAMGDMTQSNIVALAGAPMKPMVIISNPFQSKMGSATISH